MRSLDIVEVHVDGQASSGLVHADEGHQLFSDRPLGHASAALVGLDFLQVAKDRGLGPGIAEFNADRIDRRVLGRRRVR